MRGAMQSWAEERERLLQQLEQTHAYCSSLAFQVTPCAATSSSLSSGVQVKSLQEENAQLVAALAIKEEVNGQGSRTPLKKEDAWAGVSERGDEDEREDGSSTAMSQSSENKRRWGPPVMLEPNLKFGQLEEEEESETSHAASLLGEESSARSHRTAGAGGHLAPNPSVWVPVWKSPEQG
eukprot:751395-Hanusia_phi.AAC.2